MDAVVALGPEGGEHVERVARHHRILCELPQFEAVELRFGPDFEGVDPHAHADFVDAFFVLAGEAEFRVGDELFHAEPGSFVAAPPGVVHRFRNAGDTELRLLNVHAPHAGFAADLRRDSGRRRQAQMGEGHPTGRGRTPNERPFAAEGGHNTGGSPTTSSVERRAAAGIGECADRGTGGALANPAG